MQIYSKQGYKLSTHNHAKNGNIHMAQDFGQYYSSAYQRHFSTIEAVHIMVLTICIKHNWFWANNGGYTAQGYSAIFGTCLVLASIIDYNRVWISNADHIAMYLPFSFLFTIFQSCLVSIDFEINCISLNTIFAILK